MAVKCPTCHSENTDTARFCSNCATSLISAKTAHPALTKTLQSPTFLITPGTVIAGHYEVLEKLGQGGMGEVYRALDKNLGRHVAIKVLPEEFSANPERVARFEREAKLLAVLNHPNIAAIHGLEESEGRRFLALELVEGETLHARLNRGDLPVEEALGTCREIAEGLEAAHEKGIIHRDLKPGNIMITPEGKVKILDFGLAKAYLGETSGIDIDKSPTITAKMTEPGVILGTAAYMSPEQARGRSVDKRADIWAFGCVLYECLTGTRAFYGETVSDTLAHILKGEVDWSKLPAETPALIKVLLRRCLEKDPRKRLHDIADARLEIEAPGAYSPEEVTAPQRFLLPWLAAGAAVFLFVGILIGRMILKHPQPAALPAVITSNIEVGAGHWLAGGALETERPTRNALAISSDSKFVVYSAIEESAGPQAKPQLYLRRMNQREAKGIAGTEGGINPFLSPDNRWVGFWADSKLKIITLEGGVATVLCDSPSIFGANWGRDNKIVFSDGERSGLLSVSAEGGKPEIITKPDPKREELKHRLPFCLPNGKGILFTIMRNLWDPEPWIAVLRSDTREWQTLLQDAADARYVPSGYLVFLRQGTLMAVRFDQAKLKITGQPVALVENVIQTFSGYGATNTAAGQFAISETGSLIYAEGGIDRPLMNSLVWLDLTGMEQPVTPLRFPYEGPRLSPDGKRIAYLARIRNWQCYVYDLERNTNSRLIGEGVASFPIWSPDGARLMFGWIKLLTQNLYQQAYDGSSPMERVTTSEFSQDVGSWSTDGQKVALVEVHPDTGLDISILDTRSGLVAPLLNSQFDERYPDFSPNGHWLAYTSDESSRDEVYVRAFPGPGIKLQVSSQGGIQPLWARNGKQLFYRWGDQVWGVEVRTEGGFTASKPHLLFEKPGYAMETPIRGYDISLDGKRFLMVKLGERKSAPVTELILVQNWFEELKRLGPAGKK